MGYKVILINYASKPYRKSQKKNSKTAKKYGSFDEIISYNDKNLGQAFKEKNKKILDLKRGGGYWLWKPYLIKKTLEILNSGDFLFYCDSGSYFVDSIDDVIQLSLNQNQDIIPFELTHFEKAWTKRDAFVLMDCDSDFYSETKQRLASYVLIRKTEFSIKFVEQWLSYAQDERIITDVDNQCGFENYPEYRDHRHDQSIFSLLTKKHKLSAYRDLSQYGNPVKEFYPNSTYGEILIQTRKRTYPLHIVLKKYISRKKAIFMDFINSIYK